MIIVENENIQNRHFIEYFKELYYMIWFINWILSLPFLTSLSPSLPSLLWFSVSFFKPNIEKKDMAYSIMELGKHKYVSTSVLCTRLGTKHKFKDEPIIIMLERRAWEGISRPNEIIMESSYVKCQVNDMDKRVLWVFRGGKDLCSSKRLSSCLVTSVNSITI